MSNWGYRRLPPKALEQQHSSSFQDSVDLRRRGRKCIRYLCRLILCLAVTQLISYSPTIVIQNKSKHDRKEFLKVNVSFLLIDYLRPNPNLKMNSKFYPLTWVPLTTRVLYSKLKRKHEGARQPGNTWACQTKIMTGISNATQCVIIRRKPLNV